MAEPYILHMLSPLKQVSPFDANMALDAGFDHIIPYSHVEVSEVRALVQDAMFSAPAKTCAPHWHLHRREKCRTGARDAGDGEGVDVPALPDVGLRRPGRLVHDGRCDGRLRRARAEGKKQRELSGLAAAIFGGTGVVGFASAVICAKEGGK